MATNLGVLKRELNKSIRRLPMATSYDGEALPPLSKAVIHLNTKCWKLQKGRELLCLGPSCGFLVVIWLASLRAGFWAT